MRFGVILQSWSLLTEHVQNLLGGAGQTMLDLLLAVVVLIVGWILAALARAARLGGAVHRRARAHGSGRRRARGGPVVRAGLPRSGARLRGRIPARAR